jgi:hypothetical protein
VTGAGRGGWPRCAEVAAAESDPREGTAPPARQWFLLEHPGPWGRNALGGSGVDPAAATALAIWARDTGGRVLLVRRSGRARSGGPGEPARRRRWFRVDSRPGQETVRTGTFATERELAEISAEPLPGDRRDGPLQLVCTHGRHDTCCAVHGRPVATTLAAADPDGTWECSHIGGCRFAPALVLLPHGYTFGGLPVTEAGAVALAYAQGRVDTRFLRGRSTFPPAVQAAQHHARTATGATGVDALRPVGVRDDGAGRWHVELADPACVVSLRERRIDTGRPLTCAATAPGVMRVFDVVDLAVGG